MRKTIIALILSFVGSAALPASSAMAGCGCDHYYHHHHWHHCW